MQNTNNNFHPAMRTKPAQISCHILWDAAVFKPFSYALWKYPMQSCRIKHFNFDYKNLFGSIVFSFFLKKLFDPSSVAMEKSWTIIGDEDDKSKTIANYSNVWCVVQTCTYIPTLWITKEAKKIHESWCNFGFEKSFIIPDALIKRGGGDLEVSLGRGL